MDQLARLLTASCSCGRSSTPSSVIACLLAALPAPVRAGAGLGAGAAHGAAVDLPSRLPGRGRENLPAGQSRRAVEALLLLGNDRHGGGLSRGRCGCSSASSCGSRSSAGACRQLHAIAIDRKAGHSGGDAGRRAGQAAARRRRLGHGFPGRHAHARPARRAATASAARCWRRDADECDRAGRARCRVLLAAARTDEEAGTHPRGHRAADRRPPGATCARSTPRCRTGSKRRCAACTERRDAPQLARLRRLVVPGFFHRRVLLHRIRRRVIDGRRRGLRPW